MRSFFFWCVIMVGLGVFIWNLNIFRWLNVRMDCSRKLVNFVLIGSKFFMDGWIDKGFSILSFFWIEYIILLVFIFLFNIIFYKLIIVRWVVVVSFRLKSFDLIWLLLIFYNLFCFVVYFIIVYWYCIWFFDNYSCDWFEFGVDMCR